MVSLTPIFYILFLDDDSQSEEDEHLARAQPEEDEHLAQPEEDEHLAKVQLEEDEQLAKALQESMNVDSPPRYDSGNIFQPYPFFSSGGYRYMLSLCHLCYTIIYMLVALILSLLRFQQVQFSSFKMKRKLARK